MTTEEQKWLQSSVEIRDAAHDKQLRWDGSDYAVHPKRVAGQVATIKQKVVANLHDVVEDTRVTLNDLRRAGLPEDVIEAVEAITKRRGEPYVEYLKRVAKNHIARIVKIADLNDNLSDISDIAISEKMYVEKGLKSEANREKAKHLKEKYELALLWLEEFNA